MTAHHPIDTYAARALRGGWPTACDPQLEFRAGQLVELLGIWHSVRGDRTLPERRDFSARTLKSHLRDLAFVERSGARYRVGYYGSGLVRYSGDLTGKHLDEVIPAHQLEAWHAAYDTALSAATPLRFVSQLRAFRLEHMSAESLVAPLADAEGRAAALLISVVYGPRLT
ncbi:MAG: PAS domain-containing protein [Proteobacteria bacterium]|nr:PAS domain-containing protein [Pseudomonadota bacterium]